MMMTWSLFKTNHKSHYSKVQITFQFKRLCNRSILSTAQQGLKQQIQIKDKLQTTLSQE